VHQIWTRYWMQSCPVSRLLWLSCSQVGCHMVGYNTRHEEAYMYSSISCLARCGIA
jgi:hypothetical protein